MNYCSIDLSFKIAILSIIIKMYNLKLRDISIMMSLNVFVDLCIRIKFKANKRGHSNFLYLLRAKHVINAKIILKILIAPFQA